MIRLSFSLLLAAGIGCTNIQPMGPMARMMGKSGVPAKDAKADKDEVSSEPITIPAPKPTPPLCLVKPEDVSAENTESVAQQLESEFAADQKSMPKPPSEVSRYKGGVKQE
jgi:hypothetical protein